MSVSIATKLRWPGSAGGHSLTPKDVLVARQYIATYWTNLTRHKPADDDTLIGLPNPYLVAAYEESHEFDFNEMYYWDTYFISQGLFEPKHQALVIGMLDNLCYEMKKYGIIPNASRTYLMGRSQPPLLTSFIFDLYDNFHLSKPWLKEHIKIAELEYATVWLGMLKPNSRQVYRGLSRYYDVNYIHDLAETESGWDMTPRFNRHCLNYLPIDLNSLLYKYETDFARAARLFDQEAEAASWDKKAEARKAAIDDLMWSKTKGLYYDYNYSKERRGTVSSLASYVPLWAGMSSPKQADQLVRSLKKFEHNGGVATTDEQRFNSLLDGNIPTQWAYPNGWAPLHFFVVKGLQRYGYEREAKRIACKWLKTNLDWFNNNGVFLEKYNVVQPSKPPAKGLYPSQTGFGWTNSIFERFCQDFIDG